MNLVKSFLAPQRAGNVFTSYAASQEFCSMKLVVGSAYTDHMASNSTMIMNDALESTQSVSKYCPDITQKD